MSGPGAAGEGMRWALDAELGRDLASASAGRNASLGEGAAFRCDRDEVRLSALTSGRLSLDLEAAWPGLLD
eukprot:2106994-Heterocapsa_arctica.AAC.2